MEGLEDAPQRGMRCGEVIGIAGHVAGDGAAKLGQPRQKLDVLQDAGIVSDLGVPQRQALGILPGRGQLVLELDPLLGPLVGAGDGDRQSWTARSWSPTADKPRSCTD